MPLRDGDGEGDQACAAVDLAPLAGQTPAGPGGDVAGKTTTTIQTIYFRFSINNTIWNYSIYDGTKIQLIY